MGWTTLSGASAVVERDGRLLLVRQHRPYGVHWELPSGYHEPGESFEQTAAREVLEEAGIEVEVGDLLCTLVWERERDLRRNILTFFRARPVDPERALRPARDEGIDAAEWLDPLQLPPGAPLHPLEAPVLDGLRAGRPLPFHVRARVTVRPDGTQGYELGNDAS